MSNEPPSPPSTNKKLETSPPTLPSFVLPPPPSELMARLQAFLPQMKAANEALADLPTAEGEEVVVLEEMSSDSEDEDSDESSEDSDEESSDEEAQEGEEATLAAGTETAAEGDALERLMDISKRPKVIRKKLVEEEEEDDKSSGIVEMDAE